jgi:hypothetical protein
LRRAPAFRGRAERLEIAAAAASGRASREAGSNETAERNEMRRIGDWRGLESQRSSEPKRGDGRAGAAERGRTGTQILNWRGSRCRPPGRGR